MAYAIDLSPRQTSRTLEQAVRHHTRVTLRPLAREDDVLIICRFETIQPSKAAKRPSLVLVPQPSENNETLNPQEPQIGDFLDLVGTYCDVTVHLGENRFLFSSDIVNVTNCASSEERVEIYVSLPDTVQVAQRRRFWRFKPAHSAQIRFEWTDHEGQPTNGAGWLCNVSGDGLACRTSTQTADQIGIGEKITVNFALGEGRPDFYRLDAVLCNKTPAGSKNTIILGMQFMMGQDHPSSHEAAGRLRRHLLTLNDDTARSRGGTEK